MKANFSPSINILRDADKEIQYIPTSNTRQIFQQIFNDYKIGIRSFNIIGSYGTGKSAFLLAFEKNLIGERQDFGVLNGHFGKNERFECWNIVGQYHSLIESFAHSPRLEVNTTDSTAVIKAIDSYYQRIQEQNACLVIVIDEFGKFLEYAASHTPEKELYFIQQLAEYANDERKNMLLLTTLHQGFDSYARGLDLAQRQEWEKVKGRLKELTFNEPVEMLLNLAADHLETTRSSEEPNGDIENVVTLIAESRTFPHRNTLTPEFARKLLPFDPLTGAVLTLALQRYGQNERSLFTFLQSNDHFGLNDYDTKENPYYNLACLHDYLLHNHYSYLSTKHNPHYGHWAEMRRALERVEGSFGQEHVKNASKLVKTLGLLNIFSSENAVIDEEFLSAYANHCLGISNAAEISKQLESFKIILYRAFRHKFILFEGTDLDFELALLQAATKVDAVRDVVTPLKKYFDFPYILAKAISYKQGTPRFFAFELSETPTEMPPQGEIDGTINLVFSESLTVEAVQELSAKNKQAILYGVYQNTKQIRDMLFEIAKTERVKEENLNDRVAVEELKQLQAYQHEELNRYVLHHLYDESDDIVWIFDGEIIRFNSQTAFNHFLSYICEIIYPDTPFFRNELVNRYKLSSAISTARRNFIRALCEHWTEKDLGFPKKKFPAEKSIYLTLLKKTGMHRAAEDGYTLAEPIESSFTTLWQHSAAFLEGAKAVRQNVREFVKQLSAPPLKLKQGFIDFWIPLFFFIKREDFALYHEDAYIPEMNPENLELVIKRPHKFYIKTFDVQGIKLDLFNRYRALVQQSENEQITNTSFIETVKPFLTFYRALPAYTKYTCKLAPEAIRLREVIATATDPEKTFFEDFPQALGYGYFDLKNADDSHLKAYIFQLKTAIKELHTCFNRLVDRIEEYLLEELALTDSKFPTYRPEIQKCYHSLKTWLLPQHLKGFYTRLLSELDDRNAWIGAIVQILLHKPLSEMKDEEEKLIYDRFSHAIQELDNLCKISEIAADHEKEKVFRVEVTSYDEGSQEKLIRLPRKKEEGENELEKDITTILAKSQDKRIRIDVLMKGITT